MISLTISCGVCRSASKADCCGATHLSICQTATLILRACNGWHALHGIVRGGVMIQCNTVILRY